MRPFIYLVLLAVASAQVSFKTPTDKLQPVQSLYIKPSADGFTGDLYVAATEENGISNWLTDQPVNFLPSLGLPSPLPSLLSASYAAKASHDDSNILTKKRAVVNQGTTLKYELPNLGVEQAVSETVTETPAIGQVEITTTQQLQPQQPQVLSQYIPYQYLYPRLAGTPVNSQKAEDKENKETSTSQAAPLWPSAYGYSTYPYMMMDPRFWAWAQSAGSVPQQNAVQAPVEAPVEENKDLSA